MQLVASLRVLAALPPFDQLPRSDLAPLAEQLRPLKLRPGQKLYDHNDLPPGLAFVIKGQMRLLALDEHRKPFTLQRLGPGDLVGSTALLRGVRGHALAASEPTQLWLMPAKAFLTTIRDHPQLQDDFAQPSLEELYAVAVASPRPELPPRQELRDQRLRALAEQLQDPARAHQSSRELMAGLPLPDSVTTRQSFVDRYGCRPSEMRRQWSAARTQAC